MEAIQINNNKIKGRLSVFVYKDSQHPDKDVWIAYCPELDLAGYDHGKENAMKSLEVVLSDYFEYGINNGTLEEDLIAHGWHKHKNGKIVNPSNFELMKKGKLNNILPLQEYSKYSVLV